MNPAHNPRHFLQFKDLSRDELAYVFERTRIIKTRFKKYQPHHPLTDRSLAMIFEKSSTRTRLSFEAGMQQLGGSAIYLNTRDTQLGRGEPVEDAAEVISRMVDIVMIRTFEQDIIERFARHSRVPVINGLSDFSHPCQGLADLFTIWEKLGRLEGLRLAFVGDGNNVATSLAFGGTKLGMHVAVGTPAGYELKEEVVARARAFAAESGGSISTTHDPFAAVADADVIYTDVWTSMGQEAEKAQRLAVFPPYQVNSRLLAAAKPTAIVMHCLPAHRGEEITDEVADGPQSVLFDQAENRMHAQKALLADLLG